MSRPELEFFFDPACPFCWITSKWVRVVQAETGIDVRWSYISLIELNGPYDDEHRPSPGHVGGRRAQRVIASAATQHGDEVVGPLYEAIGSAIWEQDGPTSFAEVSRAVATGPDFAAILAAHDLDPRHAHAVDDASWDEQFVLSTKEALSRTGDDVGTPIITFDPDGDSPASFFGPVISEVPSAEDSVAFYEALRTAARIPAFSELKRTKRDRPSLPMLDNVA